MKNPNGHRIPTTRPLQSASGQLRCLVVSASPWASREVWGLRPALPGMFRCRFGKAGRKTLEFAGTSQNIFPKQVVICFLNHVKPLKGDQVSFHFNFSSSWCYPALPEFEEMPWPPPPCSTMRRHASHCAILCHTMAVAMEKQSTT